MRFGPVPPVRIQAAFDLSDDRRAYAVGMWYPDEEEAEFLSVEVDGHAIEDPDGLTYDAALDALTAEGQKYDAQEALRQADEWYAFHKERDL